MIRNLLTTGLALATCMAFAQAPIDIDKKFFSDKPVQLTAQEQAALAIAQKWQASSGVSSASMPPVGSSGGMVRFYFGLQKPVVVCAVLQVCDIELQPGEYIKNVNVGDPRFSVEPAVSGSGTAEVQHLVIKPLDVGLETSIIVTTDRRTYHIGVRSHRTEFMPRVGFSYPEDSAAKWEAIRAKAVQESDAKSRSTLPRTNEYLGDLNFSYTLDGSAPWKPVRVFNDGVKTIIQMPSAAMKGEAPALLVVRREGGFFREEETVMVNYRVQEDRYIVDTVFDKAILIAGVGSTQERITINRGK